MLIEVAKSFDDEDAAIVQKLIHDIFAASRSGNRKTATKKLNALGEMYGNQIMNRVKRTLKYDRLYLKGEVY